MLTLCVYNEARDTTFEKIGELFLAREEGKSDWNAEYFDSLQPFEDRLQKGPVDFIIFVFDQVPSDPLLALVSKFRNSTHMRSTKMASIHKRFSHEGIQKALMAGVKSIVLEPISKSEALNKFRSLIEPATARLPVMPKFVTEKPVTFSAEVFGRIGKFILDPFGDLHVESDLPLSDGQEVYLRAKLAKDCGQDGLHFRVHSTGSEDTYYNYRYYYRLSLIADDPLKKRLKSWFEKNKNTCFALPKTKLLWLAETLDNEKEKLFNKSIFSVHTQGPGKVTTAYLDRLQPKILVIGEVSEATRKVIQLWIADRAGDACLVVSMDKMDTFMDLAKPFLAKRVRATGDRARYFSRKSDYSRCALSFGGRVLGRAGQYFDLELDHELALDTVFLAKSLNTYLRVVKVVGGPSFRVVCEQIPFTKESVEVSQTMTGSVQTTRVSLSKKPVKSVAARELYFLETQSLVVDLIKVFIGISVFSIICFVIYLVFPDTAINGVSPASMKEVFSGIRKAFE